MSFSQQSLIEVSVVDEHMSFSWTQLCQVCNLPPDAPGLLLDLVQEGVLEPQAPAGSAPQDWTFAGTALARARSALRLCRDLQVNAAGAALALDLLDEIQALRAQLQAAAPTPASAQETDKT